MRKRVVYSLLIGLLLVAVLRRLNAAFVGVTINDLRSSVWAPVDHGPLPEEDFIPGENHPTPVGNRHFAELIGAAIDRSSILVPRFGSAPEGGAGDVSGVAAGGATTAKKLVPETIVDVLPPDLVLVDTAPALNAYGQTSSRPLSVPGDGHPNAAGHRIIARSVEPVIATPAGAI